MIPAKADGTRVEGGLTIHQPSGEQQSIYDAAMQYVGADTPTVVFAGEEYGTGSSRDWAAKGTQLLGVKAVIAKSIERIHRANLINFGIVPFTFDDPKAYDAVSAGDALELVDVKAAVSGDGRVTVKTAKGAFTATARLSDREKQLLLAGGLLASLK